MLWGDQANRADREDVCLSIGAAAMAIDWMRRPSVSTGHGHGHHGMIMATI
jgi:hypothetical protein